MKFDGSKSDILWVLAILGILFTAWWLTGGPQRSAREGAFIKPIMPGKPVETYGDLANPEKEVKIDISKAEVKVQPKAGASSASSQTSRSSTGLSDQKIAPGESRYKDLVKINRGSASSAYQPAQEYISLSVSRNLKDSINLTGWTLKNGAGDRITYVSGNRVNIPSTVVAIPSALQIWRPGERGTLSPIVVKGGETIYIVTGNGPQISPYNVTKSFRVNKCSGYLEQIPNANFSPSLSSSCPNYNTETALANIAEDCYKFVRSFGSCVTPDFKEDLCRTDRYMNNTICKIPSYCKDLIKQYFGYESCLANHATDEDFFKTEWRIFLGRSWELWAKERESISLYDNQGLLVNKLTY